MKPQKVKKLDPEAPLRENAARVVGVRLRELRSLAPRALKPGRSTEQHDLRIAAKRLRYVLEITEPCFGPPAGQARKAARRVQGVLGELHDCDVMKPLIAEHSASLRADDAAAVRVSAGAAADLEPSLTARAPNRAAHRGLGTLSVHVAARRRLVFDRFAELWAELEENGTWSELEGAIAGHGPEGAGSHASAPG